MEFDVRETEIEKRQARLKELKLELEKQEKAMREYVVGVKVD